MANYVTEAAAPPKTSMLCTGSQENIQDGRGKQLTLHRRADQNDTQHESGRRPAAPSSLLAPLGSPDARECNERSAGRGISLVAWPERVIAY